MKPRTLLLPAVVTAVLALAGAPSSAATPDARGWWWVAQATPVPVPPPPTVPSGGLYVAGDPAGPDAIAALRFALTDAAAPSLLTLAIADLRGDLAIGACPITDPWTPAEGGAWSERPSYDCSEAASGVLSADGQSITFAVGALALGATVDLALVPGQDPETGLNATFQLALEPPDGDVLAVGGGDDGGTADDSGTEAAEPVAVSPQPAFTPQPPAASFVPAQPAKPALTGGLRPTPETSPQLVFEVPPLETRFGDGRAFRVLLTVMALGLAIVFGWTVLQPARPPQLLRRATVAERASGRDTASPPKIPVHGIGRFVRPRRGPVPKL